MTMGFYALIIVYDAVSPFELPTVTGNLLYHLDHLLKKQIIGGKIRRVFRHCD